MQYRAFFLLLLALSQAGCGLSRHLLSSAVRNTFERQHSCPAERLTLKAIPVNGHALVVVPQAPPDIAADPGRLAIWRAAAHEDIAEYTNLTAVRVTGCGFDERYLCWEERNTFGDEVEFDYHCRTIDPGDAHPSLGDFTLGPKAMQAVHDQLDAMSAPH